MTEGLVSIHGGVFSMMYQFAWQNPTVTIVLVGTYIEVDEHVFLINIFHKACEVFPVVSSAYVFDQFLFLLISKAGSISLTSAHLVRMR